MSTSRSSSPSRKPSTSSIKSAPESSSTRPSKPLKPIAPRSPTTPVTAPHHDTTTPPAAPRAQSPSSSSKRGTVRKSDDDPEESPMAKRQRRVTLDEPQRRHPDDSRSSPSSDSQSGMADTEVDQKKVGQSASSLGSTTQKKKRTRTLTTPHQAAVLHALLAQSRFPTTAMREEVGRAIGLSARKVQIWFQNQRQKARRPRSQGDAQTSNRPPQYGPYPGALYAPATSTYTLSSHSVGSTGAPYVGAGPSTMRSLEASRHEPLRGSLLLSGPPPVAAAEGDHLLGPGVPGSDLVSRLPPRSQGREPPALPSAPSPYAHASYTSRYASPSSPTTSPRVRHSIPTLRPVQSPTWRREYDPSRTLPPLVQSRPTTSSHPYLGHRPLSSYRQTTSPPPVMPPLHHRRSPSPSQERRFAHQVPDHLTGTTTTTSLPPPFTLQPAPQWQPTLPSTLLRPTSSSGHWSRPGSRATDLRTLPPLVGAAERLDDRSAEQSAQPRYIRSPLDRHRTPPPSSPSPRYVIAGASQPANHDEASPPQPPLRAGRYDPVREIFIPFSSTASAHTAAPTRASPTGGSEPRRRSLDDVDH